MSIKYFNFVPSSNSNIKSFDKIFKFDGEVSLFKVANTISSYVIKQNLIDHSPIGDPLAKFKFQQIGSEKTVSWSVQGNFVHLETTKGKITIAEKFKTSEAPLLKKILSEGKIEFSYSSKTKKTGLVIEKKPNHDERFEMQLLSDDDAINVTPIEGIQLSSNPGIVHSLITMELFEQIVIRAAIERSFNN